MTATGKRARKKYGNRFACKRAKEHQTERKEFGSLPVSVVRGNAASWVIQQTREQEGKAQVPPAPIVNRWRREATVKGGK